MDWRAVAVVVLVLGAGCTGLVGDEPVRETVTAAAVPSDAADTFAPGVTGEGVVAPAELVSAHEQALANTSYRLVVSRTRFLDGTLSYRRSVAVAVGETDYRLRVSERSRAFADNETRILIGTENGTRTYLRTEGQAFQRIENASPIDVPTGSEQLESGLEAVWVVSVTPQRAGARAYRLAGTQHRNLTAVHLPRDRLKWVDFDGRIGADGRFQAATWRFSAYRAYTNLTVVTRIEVADVGRTRVNTTPPPTGNESSTADPP